MAVISFSSEEPFIYVVLGIDANEHDQVLAVSRTYNDAKKYCIECLVETEFYDLWIEKHPIIEY